MATESTQLAHSTLPNDEWGEDRCDECGRTMPMTGASLCKWCEEADDARRHCTVCGRSLIFLDQPECSDECEDEARRALMSL